jgi:tight adherence protein C
MLFVLVASVALSVGFLVLWLGNVLTSGARPSRSRLAQVSLDGLAGGGALGGRRSVNRSWLREILRQVGEKIEPRWEGRKVARRRLTYAGYREPGALPLFLGIQLGSAGLLYFYGVLMGTGIGLSPPLAILFGFCGAAAGWVVPNFILSTRITRRQKELQKALPDFLDLLVICVEAGLGLNQALARVGSEMQHLSVLMAKEISLMNLEVRAGTPREQALMALAERTGVADLRSLATMLIQTERFGTSVADSLRVHADTMRTKRQQRAEEAAAKTTIKMVFPLAICIFPALFVVVLGPALIQIVATFAQMGG